LFLLWVLGFLGQSVVEKDVARFGFHVIDSVTRDVGHLDQVSIRLLGEGLDLLLLVLVNFGELLQINFCEDDHEWLGLEKRLNRIEQVNLLVDSVATSFTDVKQEEDGSVQMSEGCDGLHLDGVTLVERVVQDTWGIDDLPASVLVVSMADEQILGRERVWLHVHIRVGHVVDEGGLSDVGESSHDKGSGIGVNLRQS